MDANPRQAMNAIAAPKPASIAIIRACDWSSPVVTGATMVGVGVASGVRVDIVVNAASGLGDSDGVGVAVTAAAAVSVGKGITVGVSVGSVVAVARAWVFGTGVAVATDFGVRVGAEGFGVDVAVGVRSGRVTVTVG
jgi:hypothetical protein